MTYFFYDLETSGLDPRSDRIMQFAGQRTDEQLRPLGEPYNLLVRLSDEILPSPFATLTTGITPQMTLADGLSEAALARLLQEEVFTPGTVAVGYNNVGFDDEFIRHLFFRNFYDAYTWQWAEGRSRWDLLDVVRMTRALRPEGIKWTTDSKGKPSNKLTDLSSANGLLHAQAHDALSDVEALLAVARLLRAQQPQLFDWLFKLREKKAVEKLVMNGGPFIYTSGSWPEASKTTLVQTLGPSPQGAYVYDLRVDPGPFLAFSEAELRAHLALPREQRPDDYQALPVRDLKFNRCPAVAPTTVLRPEDWTRLEFDPTVVERHRQQLASDPTFAARVEAALARPAYPVASDPDRALYDGFISDADRPKMAAVVAANERSLVDFDPGFVDERLSKLLPLYKARNFPQALTKTEAATWQAYRTAKIQARLPLFQKEMAQAMQTLSPEPGLADHQEYLLEELALWLENITS